MQPVDVRDLGIVEYTDALVMMSTLQPVSYTHLTLPTIQPV